MKTTFQNLSSRGHREPSTIEALESRIAPATIIVTALGDTPIAGKTDLRQALALADADLLAHPGVVNKIIFKLPAAATQTENTITLGGTVLSTNGDVNIQGPGAGKLIIDGDGTSRVFNVSGATGVTTISGLSIINGNAGNGGAGIYATESLTLKNVVIAGNTSNFYGAAINIHGGATAPKLTISSSQITGNSNQNSTSSGIFLYNAGPFSFSKTVISGNADGIGGSGVGTISNCVISGNAGAGIRLSSTDLTINATKITGNSLGGGYLTGGKVVITGSTFENNTATYYGGGLFAPNLTSLTISKSSFIGNRTTVTNADEQGGGGIFITGSGTGTPTQVKIVGSTISDNTSALDGGGIFANNGVVLSIAGSKFLGNQAASGVGGAIATRGNTASGVVNLTVVSSMFSDNLGSRGGAIATEGSTSLEGDGTFSMTSSKVAGNASLTDDGGMLIATSAAVAIKNTAVTGNFAANFCGGLDIVTSADATITGGIISGNSTLGLGGGLRLFGTTVTVKGTVITGNVAGTTGGGIYEIAGAVTITTPSKVFANTALTDPDIHA